MWSQEIIGNNNAGVYDMQSGDMAEKIDQKLKIGKNSKRGRPRLAGHEVRSNRVVTFVTETELEMLERLALDDDRSLSAVVHRIISKHFAGTANGESLK